MHAIQMDVPLRLGPGEVILRDPGDAASGRPERVEFLAPAGAPGPLPHVHDRADETFEVFDGECTLWVDGARVVATAGMSVRVPAGTPHHWRNTGDGTLRMTASFLPAANFFGYFVELARLLSGPTPPATADVAALWTRYDTRPPR